MGLTERIEKSEIGKDLKDELILIGGERFYLGVMANAKTEENWMEILRFIEYAKNNNEDVLPDTISLLALSMKMKREKE